MNEHITTITVNHHLHEWTHYNHHHQPSPTWINTLQPSLSTITFINEHITEPYLNHHLHEHITEPHISTITFMNEHITTITVNHHLHEWAHYNHHRQPSPSRAHYNHHRQPSPTWMSTLQPSPSTITYMNEHITTITVNHHLHEWTHYRTISLPSPSWAHNKTSHFNHHLQPSPTWMSTLQPSPSTITFMNKHITEPHISTMTFTRTLKNHISDSTSELYMI